MQENTVKDNKIDNLNIIKLIYDEIEEAKSTEINIINVEKISSITDFFVICTGEVDIHIERIASGIIKKLKEIDIKPLSNSPAKNSGWGCIDYGFIIIHIFTPELRKHYDLDRLWSDGKKINL